jgi:hypothetical protein
LPSALLNFYKCRRRAWRWRVEHGQEAVVEFENGGPKLEIGATIDGVTVDVGGIQIPGSLRVLHVTQQAENETICGAEFTPATESDQRMMALILDFFEKRNSQKR